MIPNVKRIEYFNQNQKFSFVFANIFRTVQLSRFVFTANKVVYIGKLNFAHFYIDIFE